MPEARFTAACVQMRSGRDPAANRDAAVAGVREAASRGAAYVQTPEMTSLVERSRERLFAHVTAEEQDQTLAALRETARQTGTVVQIGSIAVRSGDKIANRAYLIGADGAILASYDKLHLFDVDLPSGERWRESATYSGGACAVLAETPWATLGLTICYDIRFPALYRALAEAGADVLTAPACFTRQTGEAHWHVLQRARAIETGAFVISAAQGGLHEDGRETYGHSLIVDPWGRVLADAGGAEPGIILAEIDLAQVAEARARIPSLQHGRPFTIERVSSQAQAAHQAAQQATE
ncbi:MULTISPECIES: carbon-nitrogen hydrolase family protein [unclassified Methylobacterium]|uniref:carbon-nitrogen hydrolase family protein n=1 Tax=unclassified Methylobacterium TaxID=2615210 RepID=UPI0005BCF52C|nr:MULTISPECIES: carbon-nitrogen hydrolase family protein [unclassified Methylobacterium]KOX59167.1 amidohydrolase [Streptomyces purpurogeneiscleroticus]MDE4909861.1 carbon-nitrogen hydrolase family protein [Methylobacterium sp. 092160098-2]RUP13330.1 MAG: carbon-nitrogen hydrolase family protein [Methylobacterium sp.]SFU55912.1 Predicted amidohydrolase [Methylobacterium sp. UNCCL125]